MQSVAGGQSPIVLAKPKVVTVSLVSESPQLTDKSQKIADNIQIVTEDNQSIVAQDKFTEEDLIRVWRMYARKIGGEVHTSNAMLNRLPLKERVCISISISARR